MSGNIFGKIFTISIFGESHGSCIGCIISNCPSGILLSKKDIQKKLNFRKPGGLKVTPRKEFDEVEILSGIFKGQTTGLPITLIIKNYDQNYTDYNNINEIFRAGHADYTYWYKYNIKDYKGSGYASGRLTAIIVAAGAIAQKILIKKFNIFFKSYIINIGNIKIPFKSWKINNLNVCNIKINKYINNLYKNNNSCGAKIKVLIKNLPLGLGDPIYNKLNASISYALMNINAVKAIELGLGLNSSYSLGKHYNDFITPYGFLNNNSGGILGGISNGEDIIINLAVKPTSSINFKHKSINNLGNIKNNKIKGRHDACIALRMLEITNSILSLVIIDNILKIKLI